MASIFNTILPNATLPRWHRFLRHPSQSTVCVRCAAGPLTPQSWRGLMRREEIAYTTTTKKLKLGEAEGCELCPLLLSLVSENRDDSKAEFRFLVDVDPENPVCSPEDIQILHVREKGSNSGRTLYMYAAAGDPAASEITCRAPILEMDSARARTLVLECLHDCIYNHDACPKPGKICLPTRVVDCSVPSQPRLIESATISKGPSHPYTTLSYVWGKDSAHCTRTSNVDSYLSEGISNSILPQSIRDAIRVTNGLGLRYLWVDALCIIQDSDSDKREELVQMGNIYRNAHFTIIASSASSASEGFLQDRSLPTHSRLPFYDSSGSLGTVRVGGMTRIGKEPIDQRAWCLQERLLAPRKLIYSSDTLRYHCQTHSRPVENSLRELNTVHTISLDHVFLSMTTASIANPELTKLAPDELFRRQCAIWSNVVSSYSQRQLTEKTDKLLAFSAVAEQFGHVWRETGHGGRYIAGLWENFLPKDLLWHRERIWNPTSDDDVLHARPEHYIAPSWAWPSVDGHIRTGLPHDTTSTAYVHDVCDVLECNVALVYERLPYGRVTVGELKLCAISAPGFALIEPPSVREQYADDFYYRIFEFTDKLRSQLEESAPTSQGTLQIGNRQSTDLAEQVPVYISLPTTPPGQLVAVGRGIQVDDSMLKRVGNCNIHFDGTERGDVGATRLVIIDRGGRRVDVDSGYYTTAEGLLLTPVRNGKFRRFGHWELDLEKRGIQVLDTSWMGVGAQKQVIELE